MISSACSVRTTVPKEVDALDKLIFPGGVPSRTTVEEEKRKAEANEPAPVSWDSYPIRMTLNGVEKEFFPIGAMALALGRKPVTIRQWEEFGRIPKCQYRTRPPAAANIPGKKAEGKRLYTRAQIKAVIKAAERAGVDQPDPRKGDWDLFRDLVFTAWKKLQRQGQVR